MFKLLIRNNFMASLKFPDEHKSEDSDKTIDNFRILEETTEDNAISKYK